MDTYESYLQHPAGNVLTFEEALQIYNDMAAGVSQCCCEYKDEIVQDFLKKAFSYAAIRAEWGLWTKEERREKDEYRTIRHNSFIDSLNILCRLLNKEDIATPWREQLGNERKRIGDFACFTAYIAGLNNR